MALALALGWLSGLPFWLLASRHSGAPHEPITVAHDVVSAQPPRTLVIYAYYENVKFNYRANFDYFLARALSPSDASLFAATDFVLVLSGEHTVDVRALRALFVSLPVLIIERENACYDFGSHGAALAAAREWRGSLTRYRYFLFVNSSVRGPFLPTYAARAMDWTAAFTSMINDAVRLAGLSINCLPHVHVQSMVFVTDATGLALLERAHVFNCTNSTLESVVANSELRSSLAILEAGYTVDCLLYRYSRPPVDWRARWLRGLPCNGQYNPWTWGGNDGISIHPFETVFVKAKTAFPNTPLYGQVQTLSRWTLESDHVNSYSISHEFVEEMVHRAVRREVVAARECGLTFDRQFFAQRNELRMEDATEDAWRGWAAWRGWDARWLNDPSMARGDVLTDEECRALTRPHRLQFENEACMVD